MKDIINVNVTVQMEQHGSQLFRGRPIGPWKVQAVGSTVAEVLRRLEKRLNKLLPKSLPTTFYEGTLPEAHETWTTAIRLDPLEKSSIWEEPINVELACFRWQLESGQVVVRVPAVGCTLFGKADELNDAEVAQQSRISLIRLAEDLDLFQLRRRFQERSYGFHSLSIRVPISTEKEKQEKQRSKKGKTATLRSTASDLTKSKPNPVFGLDKKAQELAEHLVGENPQSVLLVGPSGVGKSALVHQLVTLRESLGLAENKIWTTTGARIVSGMSGLGMWQERCSKMIKEANATKAIIHLGSLFELMEAGKIDSSPGVASMVRQAINRRKLVAIAECTPEQLAVIERDDPMLLRAFSRMELKEPSAIEVKDILREASKVEPEPNRFSEQAIEELYRLFTRFATYSALPATALRLMRTMGDGGKANEGGHLRQDYESDDVARAFARQTGLPRFLVDDSVQLDLEKVRNNLTQNVIGQEEPVDLIVNLIATLKARLVRPGKPLASLMFIGPTGVGKTEMAKAIARLLYSDTQRMIRIDMSEYSSPWSTHKLIGKPGEGDGALTSPIREQPFSVVLLDEFEKADSNVFDLLLQLLGEGRLTDSQGRLADFRNAVVIMTSNLGVETFRESKFGFGKDGDLGWRDHFQREVRKFVRPEFLGRIDRIVPFQPLPKDIVEKIAARELDLLRQRAGIKFSDASLTYSEEAVALLSELGYQPNYGARPLRRAIEENVTIPLANALSNARQNENKLRFHIETKDAKIVVRTEKLEVKTESTKDRENEVMDSWQELGSMARCTLTSGPMRNLENELERTLRQLDLLQRKLKEAVNPRRIAVRKEQIQSCEAIVERSRKLKQQLETVVAEINGQQLKLMLSWYRNAEIDWQQYRQEAKTLRSRLRQAAEDMVEGRLSEGSLATLFVVGKSPAQLEVLWRAYDQVASANRWGLDVFVAKKYDALLDPESAEYRRRVSERRDDLAASTEKPKHRLKSSGEEEEKQKLCDLFLVERGAMKGEQLEGSVGFVLQLKGEGITNWLENEAGVTHFFDTQESGSKRRIRCKVTMFEGKASAIELASDWLELVASPSRDPIRTFFIQDREISDRHGERISYAKGKLSEGLARLIEREHEQALWRAIGYNGVPVEATLRGRVSARQTTEI